MVEDAWKYAYTSQLLLDGTFGITGVHDVFGTVRQQVHTRRIRYSHPPRTVATTDTDTKEREGAAPGFSGRPPPNLPISSKAGMA